jgi:glycosyltransferase involved in cell wall biosynthesis
MPPILSVIIPAYNAARYLEETVRAVLAQNFMDWELIVVNNASTDDTAAVLKKLEEEFRDPRIRVITHASNLPACENWNQAILHAQGEFIKVICADDLPAEGSFFRQVQALRNHPSASLVTGGRVIINSRGKSLFTTNRLGVEGLKRGWHAARQCALSGTNIIGDPVHVTWRRTSMEMVGPFDPDVEYATDLEFWLRLLSVGDLYYDPRPAGLYRIHGAAASSRKWRATADWVIKILRKQNDQKLISLSKLELLIIALKAYVQAALRGQIYRFLG